MTNRERNEFEWTFGLSKMLLGHFLQLTEFFTKFHIIELLQMQNLQLPFSRYVMYGSHSPQFWLLNEMNDIVHTFLIHSDVVEWDLGQMQLYGIWWAWYRYDRGYYLLDNSTGGSNSLRLCFEDLYSNAFPISAE